MKFFNKYSSIALLAIATIGCTANMTDRLREQLMVESGSFNKLRAKNLVRESLNFPTEEYSLSIQSASPLATQNGSLPLQFLRAQFVPEGERMIFASIDPLLGEIKPEFEFVLLESGQVKVYGKNGVYLADEIPFVAADGLLASSPINYALVSKEKKTSAVVSFTPLPLAKSHEGKKLSLKVDHPMLTRFLMNGEGFTPNEAVSMKLISGTKEELFEVMADSEGKIATELHPYQVGTLGGEAQITAGDLVFDFPWGTYLEKKTYEEKSIFPILFVINRQPAEFDDLKIQKAFASYTFSKN